ncbi:hypothetical protein ACLIJR_16795, partial [Hydrogenophaga sp. XSHU_21]
GSGTSIGFCIIEAPPPLRASLFGFMTLSLIYSDHSQLAGRSWPGPGLAKGGAKATLVASANMPEVSFPVQSRTHTVGHELKPVKDGFASARLFVALFTTPLFRGAAQT